MLTVNEVAEKYNVSTRTVRRWIADHGLPVEKIIGSVRIDPAALEQWKRGGQKKEME